MPLCGFHSTPVSSASGYSRGPAFSFSDAAHPVHSSRTRSPSKSAVPSPAVAEMGTSGTRKR